MMRILTGIILILLATSVWAGDFTYHGSFFWNDIRDIYYRDGYLYAVFYNGLGVFNFYEDNSKKRLKYTLDFPDEPYRMYAFDTLAFVLTDANKIVVVNIADPAAMEIIGDFETPDELYDLELDGDYLYAAAEYDGLFRYDISDPANVIFKDSSMYGIRVIDVDRYGSYLYVLDDYNGVVIYEPTADSIGAPVSELLLPKQALHIVLHNDTVYAPIKPSGYMTGSISDPLNPQYVGIETTLIRADKINFIEERMVLSNAFSGFELRYSTSEGTVDRVYPMSSLRGYAEVFTFNGYPYVVFPHGDYGLSGFNVEEPDFIDVRFPTILSAHPGPVEQLLFHRNRLHIIGNYSWYEIYDVSDPEQPERSGKIINPPYVSLGSVFRGDTVFISDASVNTLFMAIDSGRGDPYVISPMITVPDTIRRPFIADDYFHPGGYIVYYYTKGKLNGTLKNDSGLLPSHIRWTFIGRVSAVLIKEQYLYYADFNEALNIGLLDSDYDYDTLGTVAIGSDIQFMIAEGDMLYAGTAEGLTVLSLAVPAVPEVVFEDLSPGSINELILQDDLLICAAENGACIYDVSTGTPQLLLSGTDRAVTAALDDNILAISDGHSVKLYSVYMAQVTDPSPVSIAVATPTLRGYPNPFNPEITLKLDNFATTAKVRLEIFNILGRRVKELDQNIVNPGDKSIVWDGTDSSGRRVASGMYIFRATQGERTAVYKAVLLK